MFDIVCLCFYNHASLIHLLLFIHFSFLSPGTLWVPEPTNQPTNYAIFEIKQHNNNNSVPSSWL